MGASLFSTFSMDAMDAWNKAFSESKFVSLQCSHVCMSEGCSMGVISESLGSNAVAWTSAWRG
jgi:hypothetical protein